jgi:hypothetical protein
MELTKPLIRKRDRRGVYQSVNLNEIPASMDHLLHIEDSHNGLISESQDSGAMWMSPSNTTEKELRTFEKITIYRE